MMTKAKYSKSQRPFDDVHTGIWLNDIVSESGSQQETLPSGK